MKPLNLMIKNILISASLFPTDFTPQRGLFVQKRLDYLQKSFGAQLPHFSIYVPTPYIPLRDSWFLSPPQETPIGKVTPLQHLSMPIIGRWVNHYFVAHQLEPKIKEHKPDILVAEYAYPDGMALAILGKKYNIPVIITARGTDIAYFLSHFVHKNNLRKYLSHLFFIAVSRDMKSDLEALNIPSEKIAIIGNGVDFSTFQRLKRADGMKMEDLKQKHGFTQKKNILSVGTVNHNKGHDTAIRAIALLEDTDLWIAGEGPQKQEFIQLSQSLNISHRVHFIGRKTHKALSELYNISDLFLLCSHREGRANVLLEAAACGCPLLSSDVQGTREIIINANIGAIFSNRYPQSLAEQMRDMLAHPYDREYIEKSVQKHSWEAAGERYKKYIAKIYQDYHQT